MGGLIRVPRIRRHKALSGKETLDLLVKLVEKVDELFTLDHLHDIDFIQDTEVYDGRSYRALISQAVKAVGLGTKVIPGRYQPPFGITTNQTLSFGRDREKFERLLPHLKLLDEDLFHQSGDSDLLGVEYHIVYPWDSQDCYFVASDVEYDLGLLPIRETFLPLLSSMCFRLLKARRKRELDETRKEFQQALGQQVNSEGINLLDFRNHVANVFSYRGRLVYCREDSYPEDRETRCKVGLPSLYWAFALYNRKLNKPIGYRILKQEERKIAGKRVR